LIHSIVVHIFQRATLLVMFVESNAELIREPDGLNLVEYFLSPAMQQSIVSCTFSLSVFSIGFNDVQQENLRYGYAFLLSKHSYYLHTL
jgi:hypothetical protein